MPVHFGINNNDSALYSINREFQAVTGAVLLTKAKYYEQVCQSNESKINGLSEKFIWCFDDISACLSIKYNLGKKIICCGQTDIFHDESASLKKNPVNKLFLPHNINYFYQQWRNRYIIDQDIYAKDPNFNIYGKM